MIFKKFSVLNKIFGEPEPNEPLCEDMLLSAKTKVQKAISGNTQDKMSQMLREFFSMLAVCHTCMVEQDKEG